MQVIGTDKNGYPIAVQRGLLYSTVYRGVPRGGQLGDAYDVGGDVLNALQQGAGSGSGSGFDWGSLFTFVNNNPIVKGVGQRIAGQGAYPIYPPGYTPSISATGPGFFGSISPTTLLLIGGAIVAVMMLRR